MEGKQLLSPIADAEPIGTLRLLRRQLVLQLEPLAFDHGPHFIRDVVDVLDFEHGLMEAL